MIRVDQIQRKLWLVSYKALVSRSLTTKYCLFPQVDLEDKIVTIMASEYMIREVLDTLTSCCMQMAEMLEHGEDRAAAQSINSLLRKSKKTKSLPTADQIEFWREPEKCGWMQSQGEHIKTWRKRWFVLKQGYLFRFSSPDIGPGSKPRGIIDLSQVTDVGDGSSVTGKENSIKLTTATGSKCFITDSETSQVEWISALDETVARLVKIIAGVDDEDIPKSLSEQLQASYSQVSHVRGPPSGLKNLYNAETNYSIGDLEPPSRNPSKQTQSDIIQVINYGDNPNGGPPQGHSTDRMIQIDYGSIAGAQNVSAPGIGGVPPSAAHHQPPVNSQAYYGSNYYTEQQYGRALATEPRHPSFMSQSASRQGPEFSANDLLDAPSPPRSPQSAWEVHYTDDGRPFYYNTQTGVTTWEQPTLEFLQSE